MSRPIAKRHLIAAFILLLVLGGMLAAPLHAEHTTIPNNHLERPCPDGPDPSCGEIESLRPRYAVDRHYGAPLAWLNLSKITGSHGAELYSSNDVESAKLVFDIMCWGLVAGAYVLIGGIVRMWQPQGTKKQ